MQVNLVCVDETHVFKHAEDALQTHTTGLVTSDDFVFFFSLPLCSLITFALNLPHPCPLSYHGRGVIREGARRVRELCKAGVDLLHRFNACHQQLRHLFL